MMTRSISNPYVHKACALLAMLVLVMLPSEALAKKKKPSTRNIITKIDLKNKSITVNKKIYFMRSDARIYITNKKAKFTDLKVGMRATMSATVKDFGKNRGTAANTYEARWVRAQVVKPPRPDKK